jgi:xanthine dehydrogenase YagR molybdenum-binding subunit
MFGPEVALDELAGELGIDPVELRIRNEPDVDPETGKPWSSRHLVECLREGTRRFGWNGGWLTGTGVAASVYPTMRQAQSTATIRFSGGRYVAEIGAADLGTSTWGPAIVVAAREFRGKFGGDPADGSEASGEVSQAEQDDEHAAYAFGAQFAEARVHADTGEIRVPRLLGVFAAGRIINPRTARSQFIGGMTMGLSMALHETSVMDPRLGQVVNHDLAEYHVATNADVTSVEAHWLDEHDPYVNATGSKGIGEIGIVGTAAAVPNAVYHATGVRVRHLPVTLDKLLGGLP